MAWSVDTTGKGQVSGATAGSPLSYAVAPAVGAALLVVGVTQNAGTITSVTFNGVAMTPVGAAPVNGGGGGSGVTNLFYLKNPASGSHNVVVTPSTTATIGSDAISYLSLDGSLDVTNAFLVGGTTVTETLTPTESGALFVSFLDGQGASQSANSNCTQRSSDFTIINHSIYDSAANTITGGSSFAMSQTGAGSGLSGIGAVFKLTSTPSIAFGGIAAAAINASSGASVAVSGSNTVGFVLIQGDVAADNITAITWGGVSMTKVAAVKEPSDRWLSLWWVANPSSGGTIVATGGSFWNFFSFYYTGANQTSPIDSFNTGTVTSTAALAIATTLVKANCWYVMGTANSAGTCTYTSTGILRLASSNGTGMGSIQDSNGVLPTGSQSETSTCSSAFTQGGIAFSIAPAVTFDLSAIPPLSQPSAHYRESYLSV